MSKSILRLSGAHWLRVVAVWAGFFFLVAGIGEGFSASPAPSPEREAEAKTARSHGAVAHEGREAGRLTVERIASFDFNRQSNDGFADADSDPAAAH